MSISETIYQHVKTLPQDQALKVLHFVESLAAKQATGVVQNGDLLSILNELPVADRSDQDINDTLQKLRSEWP